MGVTIEPLVSVIRQGPRHHQRGDDWTVGCVLIHQAPDVVRIELARSDELALRPWIEIRQAMRNAGIRRVIYDRYRGGRRRTSQISLGNNEVQ